MDKLTDETIDTSDIRPLSAAALRRGKLRLPKTPVPVTVQLAPEVALWYQAQGKDCETRIAEALTEYVTAHSRR